MREEEHKSHAEGGAHDADGSSFGVTKVKTKDQLRPAIDKAMQEGAETMVESFIAGTEITCGCYKTKKNARVFPITEVVTSEEFFDYKAKYDGAVKEITPARISEETARRVSQLTSAIYDILGCEGIIRIDYILSGEIKSANQGIKIVFSLSFSSKKASYPRYISVVVEFISFILEH